MITEATPGSDYDEVYRNNFDEDFSITPNKTERMEKALPSPRTPRPKSPKNHFGPPTLVGLGPIRSPMLVR